MSPSKLRLKRTPAEQAEHDLRKAGRAARKEAKRKRVASDDDDHEHKRRPTDSGGNDSDTEHGPQPASYASSSTSHRAHKPDYDYIRAEVENARFRDKLWEAFEDDERLDSVEASFNSYAHIPRRWRGGGMERMDDETVDPHFMEDDDYAEWVRAGMWRKKHAAEHDEQMHREAERKAREKREQALREETRRMERAVHDEQTKRRHARELRRAVEARELYESRWKALMGPLSSDDDLLSFEDIPWPVVAHSKASVRIDDLTPEAISSFLLPLHDAIEGEEAGLLRKNRREKLRETMLRFHPDKFEGRIMRRVREPHRQHVKDAVGIVARILNDLMGQSK